MLMSDIRQQGGEGGGKDVAMIRAGFIPLLDCAILVAAEVLGFAAQDGIRLELIRETSWANIRDRLAIRHFDVAHMLAPLLIAATLGIGHLTVSIIVPIDLNLGDRTTVV